MAQRIGEGDKQMSNIKRGAAIVLSLAWVAGMCCLGGCNDWDIVVSELERVNRDVGYAYDDQSYWQSPEQTEARALGDCEDKAFLLQERLAGQGCESKVVFGLLRFPHVTTYHAWVETNIDGENYVLDVARGEIWKRADLSEDEFLNLTDSKQNTAKFRQFNKRNGNRYRIENDGIHLRPNSSVGQ